jgi:hypothetical protein
MAADTLLPAVISKQPEARQRASSDEESEGVLRDAFEPLFVLIRDECCASTGVLA